MFSALSPAPTYAGLLLFMGMVAALVFAVTKLSGRRLLALFGCGFLMLIVMWLSYASVSVQVTDTRSENAAAINSPIPTEQMWDHLNRSRIVLEGDERKSSQAVIVSVAKEEKETEQAKPSKAIQQKQIEQTRPDWVDNPPKRIGNVYREVVSTGPYTTASDCYQAIENKLREVVKQRTVQLTGSRYYPGLERMGLTYDFILRKICRPDNEWIEKIDSSVGEMKQLHLLMEFDPVIDKQLQEAYRNYERGHRIGDISQIAATILGGIVLLYGLLKIDTWTRGYYTKRLFFGVGAAILLLVLANA